MKINEWLDISQNSGNGDTVITVIASSYEELVERTANLSVSGDTKSKNVSIKQNAIVPYLEVKPSEYLFKQTGGSFVIEVKSNTSWSIVCDADWATLSKTQGKGNDTITVSAPSFEDEDDRNGTIKFYIASTLYEEVNIFQSGKEILITTPLIEVPYTGGNYSIEVTSNVDWEIIEYPSWVNVSTTSGSGNAVVNISVLEQINEGVEREGRIVFQKKTQSIRYIISKHGAGYYNTQIIPSGNVTVEIEDMYFKYNAGSGYGYKFYMDCGDRNGDWSTYMLALFSTGNFAYRYGSGGNTGLLSRDIEGNLKIGPDGIYLNGEALETYSNRGPINATQPLILFSSYDFREDVPDGSRIGRVRIWRDSELIGDLNPTTNEGRVCFYDSVNDRYIYKSDSDKDDIFVDDLVSITNIKEEARPYSPLPTNNNYRIYYRTKDNVDITPNMAYHYETYTSKGWDARLGAYYLEFEHPIDSIPNEFMREKTELTEIGIPSSVIEIGEYAFYKCTGLKKVYYDENESSLMTIGYEGFGSCKNIEQIGSTYREFNAPRKLLLIDACGFNYSFFNNIYEAHFHADMSVFNYASFAGNSYDGFSPYHYPIDLHFYGTNMPYFAPPAGGVYDAEVFTRTRIDDIHAPIGSDYSDISRSIVEGDGDIHYTLNPEEPFSSTDLYVNNKSIGFTAKGLAREIYVWNPNSENEVTVSSDDFIIASFTKQHRYGNWDVYHLTLELNRTAESKEGKVTFTDGLTNVEVPCFQYKMEGGYVSGGVYKQVYSLSGYLSEDFRFKNIERWSYRVEKSPSDSSSSGSMSLSVGEYEGHVYFSYNCSPPKGGRTSSVSAVVVGTDYLGKEHTISFTVYRV